MTFKQIVAVFLISIIVVGINDTFKHKTTADPATPGTVIAYYENAYQKHAIDILTKEGKIEQWPCLYTLWTRESNWNPKSRNKKSGAYGIAQFMPETWELVGFKRTSNGMIQVEAGIAYIERKYGGNICKALGSNLMRGWY